MGENETKIVCICIVILHFLCLMTATLVIASPISLLQSAGGFGGSSLKPRLLTSLTPSSHVREC